MYNFGERVHILEKCLPQLEDIQGTRVELCKNLFGCRCREYRIIVAHILGKVIGTIIRPIAQHVCCIWKLGKMVRIDNTRKPENT
jgi:hypothetical protein